VVDLWGGRSPLVATAFRLINGTAHSPAGVAILWALFYEYGSKIEGKNKF